MHAAVVAGHLLLVPGAAGGAGEKRDGGKERNCRAATEETHEVPPNHHEDNADHKRRKANFFERYDPVFDLHPFFIGKPNREATSDIYFDDCRNVRRRGK